LMIVVAIIGILAAVALPAYQDYTVRAKVSEIILAASSAKVAVAEAAQAGGSMGAIGSVATQASKYVASVSYSATDASNGVIVAVGQGDANINGKGVQFSGVLANNGQVVWTCAAASGGSVTPMDSKYLPASCK
jgi:type IV pilus assembly protein PilA